MKQFLADPTGYEHVAQSRVGYVGNDLRYIFIEAVALGTWEPYDIMFPRWQQWETLLDHLNANSPTGINNSYQTSSTWQWMITEHALLRNAFQGMALAAVISFIVLLLTTRNILMAIYSITMIAAIAISVLGVVSGLGWQFGMTVSITVVIMVGFSVDYVIHLGDGYMESQGRDTEQKTRQAMKKMGGSVLGGSITTFGTGAVLFFTSLVFFNKFAVVISTTILFSLVWSLVVFPAILVTVGPVGGSGDLRVWYGKLRGWMKGSE